MKSNGDVTENPQARRIKGPYSIEETEYLQSLIDFGLRELIDVGKGVNYEKFCTSIINSVPENIYAPEFIKYWEYWLKKFKRKRSDAIRKKIFETCIMDLKVKGLIPYQITGLTGNFSSMIREILEKSPNS